jgi:hypothetical protein
MFAQAAGGGGYSGEIKSDLKSGGTSTATFGAINFGSNSSLGGATTSTGSGVSNTLLYVGIAAGVLILFFFFRK